MTRFRPLLATVFAGLVALGVARDFVHREATGIDFHTYLAAALVGMRQGWSRIYDEGPVAAMQQQLDAHVATQPFLSTPPMALLVAPFAGLPYPVAYYAWGAITLAAFTAALAWSSRYRGPARWLATAAAIVPWWVIHAIHVGQVAPLIAAAVLVAWRLLREDRQVAAGLVLLLLLLKPNTAPLVPVALLFTRRFRAFGVWAGASGLVAIVSVLMLGPHGVTAYTTDLTHLPANAVIGASQLTVGTAFELSNAVALAVRVAILAVTLGAMYRYRQETGMAIAVAACGSLLIITYLHGSDLCLFLAAGWIVWNERPQPEWRAVLAGIWVLSTPLLDGSAMAPALNRWVICELVVLAAFAVDAFGPVAAGRYRKVLTGWAASRWRAPA